MTELEDIYAEAKQFIEKHFPDLNQPSQANNWRITMLSLMKMILELRLANDAKQVG